MKLEPMIYTNNIKKSIKFYTDILEFEIEEYYPNKDNPTCSFLSDKGSYLIFTDLSLL